jgi:hypothetical protein
MQGIYAVIEWMTLIGVIALLVIPNFRKEPRKRWELRVAFFLNQIKIEGTNMALKMNNTQQAAGKLKVVNSQGEPAEVVAGSVDYFIDDADLVDVIEDPDDETKLTVVSKSKTGAGVLTIKAKTLNNDGVEVDIEAQVAIEIVPAGAAGFAIEFEPPTDVPA